MGFFVLICLVSFLGWSIYGLVHSRRRLAEAQRVAHELSVARWTSIRDAPASGRVVISGTASAAEGAHVSAPFSGGDALWARAWLQTNVGDVVQEWVERVDTIVIDDRSGRVAKVDLDAVRVRLAEHGVSGGDDRERIAAYLTNQGRARGESGNFAYESVLRPSDVVSVMGSVAAADVGYRQSDDALRFSGEDEILVFDSALEPSAPDTAWGLVGCAIFGIVLFSLGILVTLAKMFGD
jgi:hypothetical protein